MNIKLKNLPPKGRDIKTEEGVKTYFNGDIVSMSEAQANAYVLADVGEEVQEAEPKEATKPKEVTAKKPKTEPKK